MAKTAYDHSAVRQAQMALLSKEIDKAIYTSESERDFNTVAILLLLKSLSILTTRYTEDEVGEMVIDALSETLNRRRVPVTEEYASKQETVTKWLALK